MTTRSQPIPESVSLTDPSLYVNRELSLLAFQRRVLEEAQDSKNRLLERIKFLSIVGSNLDEFFMIRVAGLMRQLEAGTTEVAADGMTPAEQLEGIRAEVASIMATAHKSLHRQLMPALEKAGVRVREYRQLSAVQQARAEKYFFHTVFPVLTPLAFDPGRPFPHISNLSLNLAVLIRDEEGEHHFARIKVPGSLPQLISVDAPGATSKLSTTSKSQTFVWLEDIIAGNLNALFPGMEILEAHPFHVTRDAEIAIQELEAGDLLENTEEGLRQRRFGDVVRLQVSAAMPPNVLRILVNNLEVNRKYVSKHSGPLSLSRLKYLAAIDRPDLKDPVFVPALA